MIIKFVENLNKHFLPQIAVKIIWFMNYLIANCTEMTKEKSLQMSDFEKMKKLEHQAEIRNLWEDQGQITKGIVEALQKWTQNFKSKNNQEGDEYGF